MTNRDFLTAIASNDSLSDEIRTFAMNQIDKLNERNMKRSSSLNSKQKKNEEIKNKFVTYLEENAGFHSASDIAKNFELSVQKASSLLKQLANENTIFMESQKVTGKGKQNMYALNRQA